MEEERDKHHYELEWIYLLQKIIKTTCILPLHRTEIYVGKHLEMLVLTNLVLKQHFLSHESKCILTACMGVKRITPPREVDKLRLDKGIRGRNRRHISNLKSKTLEE